LGISGLVQFLGPVQDMASFYRSLDVFVLPSVSTEGLPLVVLEAMASRVPVVATRLAGAPEVIESGVNGLLVPPGDVGVLAEALMGLAGDAKLRLKFAELGVAHVREKFTVERVAEQVAAVYRILIRSNS
jgi:glycosyltransferase involved in cell wall biosynthesis